MAFLGSVSSEGIKGLGPAAALVSLLPSATLVLALFALPSASLYPWQTGTNQAPDGLPSVTEAAKNLGSGGTVALLLSVLVIAVLLRPFQIAAVQFLEGYWRGRALRLAEAIAIERHRRRRSIAAFWADPESFEYEPPENLVFQEIASSQRRREEGRRTRYRAESRLAGYPHSPNHLLPTSLGNILRRAETTAGERYGLDTVTTYPRLYPNLSQRLDARIGNQLNVIDTSSALVFVFTVVALASGPLLWRPGPDLWRLLPLLLAVAAIVAYRGTRRAADLYADLLLTAYDLHRFEMLSALHRKLPATPQEERDSNAELTTFLLGRKPFPAPNAPLTEMYSHPDPPAVVVAAAPSNAGSEEGGGKPEAKTASDSSDGSDPNSQSQKVDSATPNDVDRSTNTQNVDDRDRSP